MFPARLRTTLLAALGLSLALFWINFLTTGRWADVDGALNGARRSYFALALISATLAWLRQLRRPVDETGPPMSLATARMLVLAAAVLLAAAFLVWLPPSTWTLVPFLDDWPIRYQSALDMKRLLETGTFTGWEWRFLGGYHSSSDATQGLGTLTWLPMVLFGALPGFHLTHVALFALVTILLWIDLSLDPMRDRRVVAVATAAACLTTAGYSYTLIRSGDTNSLGGVVMAMVAVVGGHAARLGRPWGVWVLVPGLTLTAYAHPGFFGYACLFLALDAVLARDWRAFGRALLAGLCAVVGVLPLSWEIWQYPGYFQFNNVVYEPPALDAAALARQLYYNVEMLVLPQRWFNDFVGLSLILLPVTAVVAFVEVGRARFHAAAALATLALMRLHNVHAGYVFQRPMHMLAVFVAPVVALLVVRHAGSRWLRWSLVAVVAVFVHVWWVPVPHVTSVRDFNPGLIERVETAPGLLVLVENNPHRNMNAEPGGQTEPSRFGTHFEVLVAEETGRRLYSGGHSDGWQWNPWKGQVVAGGTFMGRGLSSVPHDTFVAEMRRWGVADLFVWSATAVDYLSIDDRFERRWSDDTWTQFRLSDVDAREVITLGGSASLIDRHAHGATIVLDRVPPGTPVVVRTNHHPAWTAEREGEPVPLSAHDGQLAFAAPCTTCRIDLRYPARRWLLPLAAAVVLMTTAGLAWADRPRRP